VSDMHSTILDARDSRAPAASASCTLDVKLFEPPPPSLATGTRANTGVKLGASTSAFLFPENGY
jgi:hypothetical protein